MSKIAETKELEAVLKIEKPSNVKILHRLIFDNNGDRKNYQRIDEVTEFPFETICKEYEEKSCKIRNDFSLNELITICNVLCINNLDSLEDLTTRIFFRLCDLSVLKSNILRINNSDTETDLLNANLENRCFE